MHKNTTVIVGKIMSGETAHGPNPFTNKKPDEYLTTKGCLSFSYGCIPCMRHLLELGL